MFGLKMKLKFRDPKTGQKMVIEMGPPRDEKEAVKLFAEWFSDNRIIQYLGMSAPVTESAEQKWMSDQPERKDAVVWMTYVDGELVGSIGLHRIDLEDQKAELGIAIGNKEFWGKGIATAIEIAVVEYAFQNVVAGGLNKLYARVFTENKASLKAITEKVGFETIGTRKAEVWKYGRWYDEWNGELLAKDWRKIREERIKKAGIEELNLYFGCVLPPD